ncbi:MAG: hypothetical protein LBG59_01985 [Candidatus Peribacteria bacterium]|jgi:hypothetical protein|nr:hypothetical protein [Candidatus Peribacteria bacterium]
MNNNTLFQQLKQWGLKVSVSSIIFISVVLLGGAIITMALPSSLNDVKSSNANNQLTAENWDYLVEQVSGQVSKLTNLSGKISINTTNITSLSGKLATLSGTVNTLTNTTSSVRTKNGNNIYYSSGNVGIGLVPNYQYALDISGYMKIW